MHFYLSFENIPACDRERDSSKDGDILGESFANFLFF